MIHLEQNTVEQLIIGHLDQNTMERLRLMSGHFLSLKGEFLCKNNIKPRQLVVILIVVVVIIIIIIIIY